MLLECTLYVDFSAHQISSQLRRGSHVAGRLQHVVQDKNDIFTKEKRQNTRNKMPRYFHFRFASSS